MITRTATLEDLPILLDFEQGIIDAERPMDITLKTKEKISYYDLSDYIKSDHTEVVIAEVGGEIVGSGYGQIRDRKDYFKQDRMGYIGFMFVKDEFRGQGISQKIIRFISDWFTSQNITEIQLDVYDQNPSAIKAYEKAGFEKYLVRMRMNVKNT
ncbi:Ribosomal protein S18 acetylase RimI [Aquimarina amphilecti]|uniref:Ribosomal protein S18 acetylase RimI n=1 Tax=Aquimarina amphilecti TaxID=1038014 RepID=A0A1H7M3E3_AQUAM|nr:GNAT family N-acetyltransferase [Aquimarina amphilecti]SEL05661.1 Ribosomal protein S18 acetylase RimI [Aquimarina amphilecti]